MSYETFEGENFWESGTEQDFQAIEKQVKGWGIDDLEEVYFFSSKVTWEKVSTDTQALIINFKKNVIVVFRGTDFKRIADLITDANCLTVELTGSKDKLPGVHSGFAQALENIWNSMSLKREPNSNTCKFCEKISELSEQNKNFWFTGHSLGGALATLALAKFPYQRIKQVTGLYTFGQPRCGTDQFVKAFSNIFRELCMCRFAFYNDPITVLPPGYSHIPDNLFPTGNNLGKKFYTHIMEQIMEQLSEETKFSFSRIIERAYLGIMPLLGRLICKLVKNFDNHSSKKYQEDITNTIIWIACWNGLWIDEQQLKSNLLKNLSDNEPKNLDNELKKFRRWYVEKMRKIKFL